VEEKNLLYLIWQYLIWQYLIWQYSPPSELRTFMTVTKVAFPQSLGCRSRSADAHSRPSSDSYPLVAGVHGHSEGKDILQVGAHLDSFVWLFPMQ